MRKRRLVFVICGLVTCFAFMLSCQPKVASVKEEVRENRIANRTSGSQTVFSSNRMEDKKSIQQPVLSKKNTDISLIHAKGGTLESRISAPNGYRRIEAEKGDFLNFLRNYKMKKDESPVLLHNKKKKVNQKAHIAVFDMNVEKGDIQQCADSIMRIYAEFFRSIGKDDQISFRFVSGFQADYSKWKKGNRIQVQGNKVKWVKETGFDNSDKSFQKYLRMVFSYAGTMSMEMETRLIEFSDIKAGDVFLKGGSPGHVVMIADICENANGEKAFLLAQGYMPAQDFHILNNPMHKDDPWYYETELTYPLITPEYRFDKGSLKRLCYEDALSE